MAECLNETCKFYQEEVDAVPEDHGIGSFECWGVKGFDSHMVMVCPECGEPVEASYMEWKAERDADHADYLNDCRRDREAEEQWERNHKD